MLEMEYVRAWSLHKAGAVLDRATLWLQEGERQLLVETPGGTSYKASTMCFLMAVLEQVAFCACRVLPYI